MNEAKARPEDKKLTVGVVEVLGPSHIAALKMQRLGVPMNIIPLAGGAKGLAAVLGGHVDALMTVKGASMNTANKLNFLGVAADSPDPELAGVKTFKELGYPVEAVAARIWIAPKGLSQDVKKRYEAGFKNIYSSDAVKDRLAKAGQPVNFGTEEELRRIIDDFNAEAKDLVNYYQETRKK